MALSTGHSTLMLAKSGVVEFRDGGPVSGETIAPPKDLKGIGGLSWLEYAPTHDTFYLMKMGTDLYRLSQPKR